MTTEERMERVADALERNRGDLTRYVTRLVVRRELAEEVVQTAALRALSAEVPATDEELRPCLFRIATNLAIDELRRHANWRETALIEGRAMAESDPEFAGASAKMRGSPEFRAIAREHLAFCFSCTLRNLDPRRAAALLLKEVYGFSVAEIASILEDRVTRVKNWLQEARRTMEERYARTCALINKQGVCYQCVELSDFFNGTRENPLQGSQGTLGDRLAIVREIDTHGLGKWHQLLLGVFDE